MPEGMAHVATYYLSFRATLRIDKGDIRIAQFTQNRPVRTVPGSTAVLSSSIPVHSISGLKGETRPEKWPIDGWTGPISQSDPVWCLKHCENVNINGNIDGSILQHIHKNENTTKE